VLGTRIWLHAHRTEVEKHCVLTLVDVRDAVRRQSKVSNERQGRYQFLKTENLIANKGSTDVANGRHWTKLILTGMGHKPGLLDPLAVICTPYSSPHAMYVWYMTYEACQ
jgi:hypothetical protein